MRIVVVVAVLILAGVACSRSALPPINEDDLGTDITDDEPITPEPDDVVDPTWWNTNWPRRQLISITATDVGSLDDFPLAVRFDREPGTSVRFLTADGTTELPFDAEAATSGELFWVKVPHIGARATTRLWAYTRVGDGDDLPASATWSNDYAAVWHLDESVPTSGLRDATGHGFNGTTTTLSATAVRATDFGFGYRFDAAQFIDVATTSTDALSEGSTFTIEAWIQSDGDMHARYQTIVGRALGTADGDFYYFGEQLRDAPRRASFCSGPGCALAEGVFPTTSGAHVAAVRDGGSMYIYVNGEALVRFGPTSTPVADEHHLTIGGEENNGMVTELWAGLIDEVRFSGVARSGSWLRACAHNARNDWVVLGDVEFLETD